MRRSKLIFSLLALISVGLASMTATAALVMQMGMADLVANADKVFRGTVIAREPGTVSAGGSEFSTVIYTVRVDDALKGNFGSGKDAAVVELTMLGSLKKDTQTGDVRHVSALNLNPDLSVGREYVLFTTSASAIGLSTTVGLNQGLFRVFNNAQGREMTANGLGNQGLFDGAVSYDELKTAVRAASR